MRFWWIKNSLATARDCEDLQSLISEKDCVREEERFQPRTLSDSAITQSALIILACLFAAFTGVLAGRRYPSNNGAIRHVSKFSMAHSANTGGAALCADNSQVQS
jgi:hypothetical protein